VILLGCEISVLSVSFFLCLILSLSLSLSLSFSLPFFFSVSLTHIFQDFQTDSIIFLQQTIKMLNEYSSEFSQNTCTSLESFVTPRFDATRNSPSINKQAWRLNYDSPWSITDVLGFS
jgi:hypothetical protein